MNQKSILPQKKFKLESFDIIITAFPGRTALRYKNQLIEIFGPQLLRALQALGSEDKKAAVKGEAPEIMDTDLNFEKIAEAIERVFTKLPPDIFEEWVFDLLASTQINGELFDESLFDITFSARLDLIYKLIGHVLELNYSSFFGKGGIGKIKTKLAKILS